MNTYTLFPKLALCIKALAMVLLFTSAGDAQVSGPQASLTYAGSDGQIEYDWVLPAVGSIGSLGTVHIKTRLTSTPYAETVLSPFVTGTSGNLAFQSATWVNTGTGISAAFTYKAGNYPLQILVQLALNGRFLTAKCTGSQEGIQSLGLGPWPGSSAPRPVPIPYYPGWTTPAYLSNAGVFGTAYFDWRSSNATLFQDAGNQMLYRSLTNGHFNTLSERIVIGVSKLLPDLFPDVGSAVSPYLASLSGKLVIDIWGGWFQQNTYDLLRFGWHGIGNCAVLIHEWQTGGFDNELPQHFPANIEMGGSTNLLTLANAAQGLGCLFALHENYSDYYPNFPGFTNSSVALQSDGTNALAWFNPSSQIQSYALKPTAIAKYAAQQSPQIHTLYNTTATFIDVNSSAPPWFHTDQDATVANAGTFASYMNASTALWSFERAAHKGPVFGEGNYHSFWTGQLDGAEAQFGAGGVPWNAGTSAPLLVDFDLMKIHPYQVNHGMGYYERWIGPGDDMSRTDTQDAYRMQEIIFGHAPYMAGGDWRSVPKTMIEQYLVGPVAARYGTQTAASIQYQYKGNWTDVSTAAKAGVLNRVQVRYANGDTIVANGTLQPMTWLGMTLPMWGWMASGNGLLAYTAQQPNGQVVDYAETANSIFANARNQRDMQFSSKIGWPQVSGFTQPGAGSGVLELQWQAFEWAPADQLQEYLYLLSQSNPQIPAAQFNKAPAFAFNNAWTPGAVMKDSFPISLANVADGTYTVTVVLFNPSTIVREALAGVGDGTGQIILGSLSVSQGGKKVSFQAGQNSPAYQADSRLNFGGSVVDFGSVRTDGMVALNHDVEWTLRAYPLYRDVVIQVKTDRIQAPGASLHCEGNRAPVQVSAANGYWQIHMNGATSCRW